MAAKRRSLRLPQKFLPPLKTFGFCCAKPKKKRRSCAAILNFSQFWCVFTTKSEPISRKMAEAQPWRLRARCARASQQNHTFLFFLFSPRWISFLKLKKVVVLSVRHRAGRWGVRTSPVGKADSVAFNIIATTITLGKSYRVRLSKNLTFYHVYASILHSLQLTNKEPPRWAKELAIRING